MNNRRLWVFKELEKIGFLETIEVRLEQIPKHSKIKNNTYSLIARPILE